MKKIKVQYIDQSDPYRYLYGMSNDELIKIIKEDDATIERLRAKR